MHSAKEIVKTLLSAFMCLLYAFSQNLTQINSIHVKAKSFFESKALSLQKTAKVNCIQRQSAK